jgi:hypothetical protein
MSRGAGDGLWPAYVTSPRVRVRDWLAAFRGMPHTTKSRHVGTRMGH